MNFEWDEEKRKINIAKHGVDFLKASLIFRGPSVDGVDDREDYGETRQISIGDSGGLLLVVVYVQFDDAIRIISARKAQANGREYYYALLYS
jgi:uncharacterized protein